MIVPKPARWALAAVAVLLCAISAPANAACTAHPGRTTGTDDAAIIASLSEICGKVDAYVTPVATTAAAASLIAKASPGSLYGFSGYSTVSGWFLVLDATSAPADGAVTPIDFYPYTAAQAFAVDYSGEPLRGAAGLTIVFSTTGPYTKTASATASISAKVQ